MSGVNGTDISSWLQDVREGVDLSYYNVAFMTVLPLYDAVLTSAQELQILWRQRPRPKSICIFYLNRSSQVLLAFAIATNYLYGPYSCKGVVTSQTVAFISLYAILAFSGTLRAYALCGQRWYLCITVLVLALVPCFQDIIILAASVIYATETQCIFDIALIKWTGTIEQYVDHAVHSRMTKKWPQSDNDLCTSLCHCKRFHCYRCNIMESTQAWGRSWNTNYLCK